MKPQESSSTFSHGQKAAENATWPNEPAQPKFRYSESLLTLAHQAPYELIPVAVPTNRVVTPTVPSDASSTPVPTDVFLIPPPKVISRGRTARFNTRQLWEGTVTEVRGDLSFVAELEDRTDPSNPVEVATFAPGELELDETEKQLIQVGASFYWIIGTERSSGGTVSMKSTVKFRRIPSWTRGQIQRAAELATAATQSLREAD